MCPRKLFPLTCALLLAVCSLITVHAAAGGEIAGTVTDRNGAVIDGATVTISDPANHKIFTPVIVAVTDSEGHYKVSAPAGSYKLTVAAKGFADAQVANVVVAESKTTTADVRLEVAAVNAGIINVTAAGAQDAPKRIAANALNDLLALSVENKKM